MLNIKLENDADIWWQVWAVCRLYKSIRRKETFKQESIDELVIVADASPINISKSPFWIQIEGTSISALCFINVRRSCWKHPEFIKFLLGRIRAQEIENL